MKSFRLDPDSVSEFFETWPALVVRLLLACVFAYLGLIHIWFWILALLFCGIYGGCLLRGVLARRLHEKYPGARHVWLLSVGMTTMFIGVVARMAFPTIQGRAFDLAWVVLSFLTILTFVIINRKDQNVLR